MVNHIKYIWDYLVYRDGHESMAIQWTNMLLWLASILCTNMKGCLTLHLFVSKGMYDGSMCVSAACADLEVIYGDPRVLGEPLHEWYEELDAPVPVGQ